MRDTHSTSVLDHLSGVLVSPLAKKRLKLAQATPTSTSIALYPITSLGIAPPIVCVGAVRRRAHALGFADLTDADMPALSQDIGWLPSHTLVLTCMSTPNFFALWSDGMQRHLWLLDEDLSSYFPDTTYIALGHRNPTKR